MSDARVECDVLIVGAGCAGLSLAVHMIEAGIDDRRIVIVDPRTDFGNDRTWCFFDVEPHPFRHVTTHSWTRVTVADRSRSVTRTTDAHPYVHLPSSAFYAEALARIELHPNYELRLGTRVSDLADDGDRVAVHTEAGIIHARAVFDSRPNAADGPRPRERVDVGLLQHFVGWFVETTKYRFDPDEARLMDFRVSQADGIHFVYVLPFSPRSALVEDTYFSNVQISQSDYDDCLRAYLEHTRVGPHRVVHRERGAIPMTARHHVLRPSPRVYRIGLAGGLARPSTGYAFLAIQRFSRALAARLVTEPLPAPPRPRSPRTLLLDRTFLTHLVRHPESAPGLFTRLFERTPPDALARFLSEASSVADEIAVMRALPTRPFAQAMMHAIRPWLRDSASALRA